MAQLCTHSRTHDERKRARSERDCAIHFARMAKAPLAERIAFAERKRDELENALRSELEDPITEHYGAGDVFHATYRTRVRLLAFRLGLAYCPEFGFKAKR